MQIKASVLNGHIKHACKIKVSKKIYRIRCQNLDVLLKLLINQVDRDAVSM